jgi:hypothetical protein
MRIVVAGVRWKNQVRGVVLGMERVRVQAPGDLVEEAVPVE